MRERPFTNKVDPYGLIALLLFYMVWGLKESQRSALEFHLALGAALMLGVAYRVGCRRVSARIAEWWARATLFLAGALVIAGWVVESVALVAGANLWWLLYGARFAVLWVVTNAQALSVVYMILLFVPGNAELLRFAIGIFIALTAIEPPRYAEAASTHTRNWLAGCLWHLFWSPASGCWYRPPPRP